LRNAFTRPRSPRTVALLLALWLTTVGNLTLWRALYRLAQGGELGPRPLWLPLGGATVVLGATAALLVLLAWPRVFKIGALLLLVVAAGAQHYMLTYGIVIDPSMVGNVLQTNATEARDLLGWGLLGQLLLVAGLPAIWLTRLRLRPAGAWGHLWRNTVLFVLLLAATAGAAFGIYRELAPLMRNHTQLRYMINPLASVTSTIVATTKPWRQRGAGPLTLITAGTQLGPSYAAAGAAARPPLFVLVVGETARADHFGLNGYERDTTPELARRGVTSFTNVHSCGTNTLASVPCMFSPLGKSDYERRKTESETLMDVLQAAGLAVLWLDNQAGCKGVCERVPNASTGDAYPPAAEAAARLCSDGECLDDVMLAGLDQRIAALPAERRARGVVLVMHQMGSHGPAYHRRSSPAAKRFMPECTNHALDQCEHDALINAYDNSIAETDRFLAHTIDWLQAQRDHYATGMLYLSDHGESLGEYGIYLHGLPYAFAPEVQKHVPMVLWMADAFARRNNTNRACLTAERSSALTHDNLYHSILGLMDVQTPTYQAGLDAFAKCRAVAG
jgi:lipid A ethanolaminephosphotransferase